MAARTSRIPATSELDRGGHLAAWGQPTLFAGEMRDSFRSLREERQARRPFGIKTGARLRYRRPMGSTVPGIDPARIQAFLELASRA